MTRKRQKHTNAISISHPQRIDLFDAMCGDSQSKDACRRFVEKLEQSSQHYANKSRSR